MTIELANLEFENDFASVSCSSGAIVAFNKLEESMTVGDQITDINDISIVYFSIDDEYVDCSMAIGMSNKYMRLYSEYKELEGKTLTTENLQQCKLEVFNE